MSGCVKGERVPRRSAWQWFKDECLGEDSSATAGLGWADKDPTGTCPQCGAKPGELHK